MPSDRVEPLSTPVSAGSALAAARSSRKGMAPHMRRSMPRDISRPGTSEAPEVGCCDPSCSELDTRESVGPACRNARVWRSRMKKPPMASVAVKESVRECAATVLDGEIAVESFTEEYDQLSWPRISSRGPN